jgi:hypothetical protein
VVPSNDHRAVGRDPRLTAFEQQVDSWQRPTPQVTFATPVATGAARGRCSRARDRTGSVYRTGLSRYVVERQVRRGKGHRTRGTGTGSYTDAG